jgi:hypothetical protein
MAKAVIRGMRRSRIGKKALRPVKEEGLRFDHGKAIRGLASVVG